MTQGTNRVTAPSTMPAGRNHDRSAGLNQDSFDQILPLVLHSVDRFQEPIHGTLLVRSIGSSARLLLGAMGDWKSSFACMGSAQDDADPFASTFCFCASLLDVPSVRWDAIWNQMTFFFLILASLSVRAKDSLFQSHIILPGKPIPWTSWPLT